MSAQVAADLRAAADVLERDGWTTESYHRPIEGGGYCHCAIGAVEAATGLWRDGRYAWDNDGRSTVAWAALMRHLGHRDPNAVFDWNDSRESAAEVIAALRAAADRAEAS